VDEVVCNKVTYNSLIHGLYKTSGISLYVWDLIDEMHNRCQVDERIYNSLVFVLCKNLDLAIELVKKTIKKKIQSNLCTYNIFLDGMCKAERLKNAQEVFHNLLIKGYLPNVYMFNIMINGLCKEGLLDDAFILFSQMEDNGYMVDDVTFDNHSYSISKG